MHSTDYIRLADPKRGSVSNSERGAGRRGLTSKLPGATASVAMAAPGTAVTLLAAILLAAALHTAAADCDDKTCFSGHCVYEGCTEPVNCSGGKCLFSNCDAPSCSGGKCTFYECANPTCDGGSCEFFHPRTVLKDGFCRGGACTVHGEDVDDNMGGELAY